MSQWDSEEVEVVEEEVVSKDSEDKVIADAEEVVQEAGTKVIDTDNTLEKDFDEGVDEVEHIPKGKEKDYGL